MYRPRFGHGVHVALVPRSFVVQHRQVRPRYRIAHPARPDSVANGTAQPRNDRALLRHSARTTARAVTHRYGRARVADRDRIADPMNATSVPADTTDPEHLTVASADADEGTASRLITTPTTTDERRMSITLLADREQHPERPRPSGRALDRVAVDEPP